MKRVFVFAVLLGIAAMLYGTALAERCLYPFRSGDEYGYMDETGREVIPAQWKTASEFRAGYAIVGGDAPYRCGIIDADGQYHTETIYQIDYQNGLYIVREETDANDLFGFFDPRSKTFVKPQYDYIGNSRASASTRLVFAMRNDRVGYLDRATGEVAIPFQYDEPAEQAQFSNGYAVVSIGGGIDLSMRLITEENEAVSFPPGMEAYAEPFIGISEGITAIRDTESGKLGFARVSGDIVCLPQYDLVYRFFEGYASVCRDGLWGHIDASGTTVVAPRFSLYEGDDRPHGYQFSNGIALLKTTDGYLAINPRGDILFTKPFEKASDDLTIYPFMENKLAICRVNRQYGLIDSAGDWVYPPQWDFAEEWSSGTFSSGLEAVSVDGRYGFIDRNGTQIIACQYEDAENFYGGLARVTLDGKMMYINRDNQIVWKER